MSHQQGSWQIRLAHLIQRDTKFYPAKTITMSSSISWSPFKLADIRPHVVLASSAGRHHGTNVADIEETLDLSI